MLSKFPKRYFILAAIGVAAGIISLISSNYAAAIWIFNAVVLQHWNQQLLIEIAELEAEAGMK